MQIVPETPFGYDKVNPIEYEAYHETYTISYVCSTAWHARPERLWRCGSDSDLHAECHGERRRRRDAGFLHRDRG